MSTISNQMPTLAMLATSCADNVIRCSSLSRSHIGVP